LDNGKKGGALTERENRKVDLYNKEKSRKKTEADIRREGREGNAFQNQVPKKELALNKGAKMKKISGKNSCMTIVGERAKAEADLIFPEEKLKRKEDENLEGDGGDSVL